MTKSKMTKEDLKDWVEAALLASGGAATVVKVAEYIWHNHESELRAAGSLFYTWQYDMRWAAMKLRKEGKMLEVAHSGKGLWQLAAVPSRADGELGDCQKAGACDGLDNG